MSNRLGHRLNDFVFIQFEPSMGSSVTLCDLNSDGAFIEFCHIEADREGEQTRSKSLRGERRHNRRIDSAAQKTRDRNVGKKMLLNRSLKKRA